jgi:hypothetical protein
MIGYVLVVVWFCTSVPEGDKEKCAGNRVGRCEAIMYV